MVRCTYLSLWRSPGPNDLKIWVSLKTLSNKICSGGLDLSDTVASGARVVLLDERLRGQLLQALLEDNRLHIEARAGRLLPRLFVFLLLGLRTA